MEDLRMDYKDDILDTAQNTNRKYRMVENGDGTVSFVDMTAYSQHGDPFGAADVNKIAAAINETNSNLSAKMVVYETVVSANATWQESLGKLTDITNGEITPDTFCGVVSHHGGYVFDTYLSGNGNLYVSFRAETTFSNVPMQFVIFGKK